MLVEKFGHPKELEYFCAEKQQKSPMRKILFLIMSSLALCISAQTSIPALRIIPNNSNGAAGSTPSANTVTNPEGNFVQAVIDSVENSMNLIRQKSDELMEYVRAQELTPERRAVADSMAEAYRAIYDNISVYLRQEVDSQRESSDVARLLNRYQRLLGLDYLEEYLSTYPYADQPELADIRSQIAINQHIKPGAQLIDFELPDEVGASHHLSEYIGKGHYVLVDFWASWCGPCRQEMPNVKAAYERFHERGFDILGLSFDNNREAWLRAVADLGMTWPQLSDLKGWKSLAAQKYNVRAIPFTLLFDPEGKVVADNLRGEALSRKLEELLGN